MDGISSTTKILCIEDDKSIRDEMYEVLSLDFEDIKLASNGKEGLEFYKSFKPDLIISDVQMPILNGIDMAKEILQIDPNAGIILITAFNEDSFKKTIKEMGLKEYISKPIDINQLFESIDRCLKNKTVESEKFS